MMFIFRAIFWLAVVSAIMPAREPNQPGLGETAGKMVGAAMDYCATRPSECLDRATATAETLRIPADFVLRAQNFAAPAPSTTPQAHSRPAL
jgi:hypothetical protein